MSPQYQAAYTALVSEEGEEGCLSDDEVRAIGAAHGCTPEEIEQLIVDVQGPMGY